MNSFGNCGCCGPAFSTTVSQRAWSFAPYFMGWIGQAGDGTPIENPLFHTITSTTKIPYVIYLRLTQTKTGPSGTQVSVTTWLKDGTSTTVVTGPNPLSPPYTTTYALDQPYNFADLAAYAMTGLDTIVLLNPGAYYPIVDSQGRPTNCNFGYPNDPGFTLAPITTSTLAISMGQSIISGYAVTAGQYFINISDISGEPGAMNGVWNTGPAPVSYPGGDTMGAPGISGNAGGWFAFKKAAWRLKQPLLSQARIFLSSPQYSQPWTYLPVNIPVGEHIFLPSDVPGYGLSVWSTSQAPGL